MRTVILLSLTASLNPTLLAATTLMLLLDRPAKLMAGYLLGAYVASITLGLVIVFSLSDARATSTTRNTVNPAVDIALGTLALAVAFSLHTGRVERRRARSRAKSLAKGPKEPARWQRELSKGSPQITFIIGALFTLPGASYLAGLAKTAKLDYSTGATVLVVICFNLVMLWLIEIPLVCFLIAPESTPRAIKRVRAFVSRHAHVFAVRGFTAIGALLVIKGLIGLLG